MKQFSIYQIQEVMLLQGWRCVWQIWNRWAKVSKSRKWGKAKFCDISVRSSIYEINVDFLFPGNLVSLSVITRASLDFKTSFLRLVELVIFTVLNICLRLDANNYHWETLVSFAPLSFWKVATLSVFDCLCIILNMIIFSGPTLSETYRHQVNVFITSFEE